MVFFFCHCITSLFDNDLAKRWQQPYQARYELSGESDKMPDIQSMKTSLEMPIIFPLFLLLPLLLLLLHVLPFFFLRLRGVNGSMLKRLCVFSSVVFAPSCFCCRIKNLSLSGRPLIHFVRQMTLVWLRPFVCLFYSYTNASCDGSSTRMGFLALPLLIRRVCVCVCCGCAMCDPCLVNVNAWWPCSLIPL